MSTTAPTIGVLIRFSNSAATLPGVLAGLKQQTLQPTVILGVDSGSTDGSRSLLEAAGGQLVSWTDRYDHSKVLNFGLRHLHTDLVLVLSSHTVLQAPDTLARMVSSMTDPNVACVSGKWDTDAYYSDDIDWNELRAKGLKFGSIYSNSMGMIRRSHWEQLPFDEKLGTAEDYAWTLAQLKRGFRCRRLDFPFSYQRSGHLRHREFSRFTFALGKQHRLKIVWLGLASTIRQFLRTRFRDPATAFMHRERLIAWAQTEWQTLWHPQFKIHSSRVSR